MSRWGGGAAACPARKWWEHRTKPCVCAPAQYVAKGMCLNQGAHVRPCMCLNQGAHVRPCMCMPLPQISASRPALCAVAPWTQHMAQGGLPLSGTAPEACASSTPRPSLDVVQVACHIHAREALCHSGACDSRAWRQQHSLHPEPLERKWNHRTHCLRHALPAAGEGVASPAWPLQAQAARHLRWGRDGVRTAGARLHSKGQPPRVCREAAWTCQVTVMLHWLT